MPKAIFNLKSEPDPRLIILVFRFKKNKFQYSTGEKIAGKFWDKASYRVRATKQFPAYRSVNDLLNTLSHVCEKAHREYLSNCEEQNTVPVWHELKAHLKESLDIATMKKQADENHVRFYDFIDQYIAQKENDKTISQGTTKVLIQMVFSSGLFFTFVISGQFLAALITELDSFLIARALTLPTVPHALLDVIRQDVVSGAVVHPKFPAGIGAGGFLILPKKIHLLLITKV